MSIRVLLQRDSIRPIQPIQPVSVHLHLQDTSKLQYVEDFLEGMLGKHKFEITY